MTLLIKMSTAGIVLLLTSLYTQATQKLTFLTWEDYIDKEIVSQFETEYNAKINFVYFESDELRNELLLKTRGNGFDLLLLDSTNIPSYKQLAWITEFNINQAPNIAFNHLPESTRSTVQEKICTPYFWGTTGVAYRKDLLSQPITRWQQLFHPIPELHKKILMLNSGSEVVGMALKAQGYSMHSADPQELEQAYQLLLAQNPYVADYSAIASNPANSKLVTGEVSALITYSGDALILKTLQPEIEYIVPEEGGGIWSDFICLSAKAKNPELAHQFINFINRSDIAARNALFTHNATPNTQAEKLLPESFLNNPIIYPDNDVIDRSEIYTILSTDSITKQNEIMIELKNKLKEYE